MLMFRIAGAQTRRTDMLFRPFAQRFNPRIHHDERHRAIKDHGPAVSAADDQFYRRYSSNLYRPRDRF